MARPRSEFLGSLGKLFSIFKKVADKVLELGGSDEDIADIDMNEKLVNNIAHLILGKADVAKHIQTKDGFTLGVVMEPTYAPHIYFMAHPDLGMIDCGALVGEMHVLAFTKQGHVLSFRAHPPVPPFDTCEVEVMFNGEKKPRLMKFEDVDFEGRLHSLDEDEDVN